MNAIELLQRLHQHGPGSTYGPRRRAEFRLRRSHHEKSERCRRPRQCRSMVLSQRKEWNRVLADRTTALRLDPKCWVALGNRAMAHISLNEPDKAIADCNRGLGINPNYFALPCVC